jgi:hypothetical protein
VPGDYPVHYAVQESGHPVEAAYLDPDTPQMSFRLCFVVPGCLGFSPFPWLLDCFEISEKRPTLRLARGAPPRHGWETTFWSVIAAALGKIGYRRLCGDCFVGKNKG